VHLLHYDLDDYKQVPNNKTAVLVVLWYQKVPWSINLMVPSKMVLWCHFSTMVPPKTRLFLVVIELNYTTLTSKAYTQLW